MTSELLVPRFEPKESHVDYLKRMGDDEGARNLYYKQQVVASLEPLAGKLLNNLGKREKQWFPDQFLEDHEKVEKNAKNLSPRTVALLLGNIVTEKGLPAYMTALNKASYPGDKLGNDKTPSAEWVRGWTAQELEHEELGYGWALLSKRVNMRALHVLTYTLISNGFNPHTGNDPYSASYTTPQELATSISWKKVGIIAASEGDMVMAEGTQRIYPDENRHFNHDLGFMGGIFDVDPDGAMVSVDDTMTKDGGMVMPAALSSNEMHELPTGAVKSPWFEMFETASQQSGMYTVYDYLEIMDTLIKDWKIETRPFYTEKGEKARDHLLKARRVLAATADRKYASIQKTPEPDFSFLLKAA